MPKVSVVIPTHNRAEFVKAAIQSVLNQTYQDFEIIVVDDASKDATAEAVNSFQDGRIQYVRHETNKGEAGARNTGVMNAIGQFVAFLDDDDEWLPEKLEKQVNLFRGSSPIIGVVYTGVIEIEASTGRIIGQRIPVKRGDIFKDLATNNWIGAPSSVLLKRECFNKVGLFDENIDYGLDYDMWIRISKKFHFEYIEEPLVKYHVHENKLSTKYAHMISGYEAQFRKNGSLFALDSKAYSQYYSDLGVLYGCTGNIAKARGAFVKAIRIYPFQIRPYRNLCLSLLGAGIFNRLRHTREKLTLTLQ